MKNMDRVHPLAWAFLLTTFVYGIGFAFLFPATDQFGASSLFAAMSALGSTALPIIWGLLAIAVVVVGLFAVSKNLAQIGKTACFAGVMLWLFAGGGYLINGDFIVFIAIASTNTWYWIWQYLRLARYQT